MAELEIHTEAHAADPMGRSVGLLAAILAVLLAIVTITSHRTHTAAIIHKSTANDEWSHYQSTRVKYHNLELGQSLVTVFGAKGADADKDKVLADYAAQMKKYEAQGKEIQANAEAFDNRTELDEARALRYDIGEGLLEIALVLSSLYFISKKIMFPVMGLLAGVVGVGTAVTGLFMA